MEKDRWTSNEIDGRLSNLFDGLDDWDRGTPVQKAYREAASVLASFDPTQLRVPDVGMEHPQTVEELLGSSDFASAAAEGENQWILAPEVRRENLRRLIAENRVQEVLSVNSPRPQSLVQQMLEAGLSEQIKPLEQQSLEELRATLLVSDWLEGVVQIPGIDDVQQRIEKETLLKPFRDLIGERFAGREKELNELSDYVGVFEASNVIESAHRLVERVFSIKRRPPLMIVAPGGMGKSALIAQFILTHNAAQYVRRFPFAYLDFDRPGLVPEEPVTLLLEAVNQFAVQFPMAMPRAEQLRKEWLQKTSESGSVEVMLLPRTRAARSFVAQSDETVVKDKDTKVVRFQDREWFYSRFAEFISSFRSPDSPVLLVLDTFEEVQFRGPLFVEQVLSFLESIQSKIPELRTVLVGRAALKSSNYPVRVMTLPPFDHLAAQAFLEKLGVTDVSIASAIAEQIGGSPLTLKLAARLVKVAAEEAGPEGIRGLETGLVGLLKSKSIEAQLYHRILDHIHDPDVRRLAHPGLILREITQELIEEVLSGPCGVDVMRPGKSRELFAELSKEIALVEESESGVLIHRPDLRALTLRMLLEDEKMLSVAREINEGAIRYYARHDGSDARAEELYHLLLFNLERKRLRWRPGDMAALGKVARSIDELPERSQAFVAARLNIERSPSVWERADIEDWELQVATLARQCLAMHDTKQALSLVSQRKTRSPDSPLYALEVDILIATGDLRAATKRLDELLALSQVGPSAALELALREARLNAEQASPVSAEDAQRMFQRVSDQPSDLRMAEWLTLTISALSDWQTASLLADRLQKAERNISSRAWRGNEDLRRRVRETLSRFYQPRRLLAIDGGGLAGLIPAESLIEIERQLDQITSTSRPLCDRFNLIAGTGTGAIIAAGLALGIKAVDLRDFFLKFGNEIFTKAFLPVRMWHSYPSAPLEKHLKDLLGESTTLGSDKLRTQILIVAKNVTLGNEWFFSNNPRNKFYKNNASIPLWQVVRASTAAPTYFPPQSIDIVDDAGKGRTYEFIDATVSGYKNPALQLFLEATVPEYGSGWPAGAEKMLLLSLGTGFNSNTVEAGKALGYQLLDWLPYIMGEMMNGTDRQLNVLMHLIGKRPRLSASTAESVSTLADEDALERLSNSSDARKLLTYQRISVGLTRQRLDQLGLNDVDPLKVHQLDAVDQITNLQRIGAAVAKEQVEMTVLKHFFGTGSRSDLA